MAEQTPARFDDYSDRYREAIESSIAFGGADLVFYLSAKVDLLLESVAKRVGNPANLAFLDVGCGPGESDRLFRGRVGRLTGVDIASKAIEQARRRNRWAEYKVYAAGEPLPFEDRSFDVCFASCVLHHVQDDQRVTLLEEMERVSRPGGLIGIFEHNPYNPATRYAVRNCEFDVDAELLSRSECARLLREAGLEPDGRYILFFPRESRLLRGIEAGLGWLPLGAQYAMFAQRP